MSIFLARREASYMFILLFKYSSNVSTPKKTKRKLKCHKGVRFVAYLLTLFQKTNKMKQNERDM